MSSAIFYININGLGRSDVSENSPTPHLLTINNLSKVIPFKSQ